MQSQKIPIVDLDTQVPGSTEPYSRSILENEIRDIHVQYFSISSQTELVDSFVDGFKDIYLFVKGRGEITARNTSYEIIPETIFLPNAVESISIKATSDSLHYLKITCKLSPQDQIDLKQLPLDNTQNVYHAKFSDCQSYTEAIKSPNTVSRTILSNEYIPRIAMGMVQTKGPDKVEAHEHPMLEQLFLGLSENKCTVHADNEQVLMPEYSVVHIPLGSRHSVSVENDETLYYVWMDFFLDKKGEEWLKTHKVEAD